MITKRQKLLAVLFAAVAIAAMILLSASFRDLEFSPGRPLPRPQQAEELFYAPGAPPDNKLFGYLYTILYFLVIFLLPISIIYVIISPQARRRILRSLGLLLWLIAFVILIRARPELFEQLMGETSSQWPLEEVAVPDVTFTAAPPQWLAWGMTITLALLFAAGIVVAAWFIWRRTHPPQSPLEQLAQEAQDALVALRAGADLRDTIMRCYFEMSRIVMEQRGIIRQETMTPREFEITLAEEGLPCQPVQQLTRLFEDVRYGAKATGGREERQAIDCLAAIADACITGGVSLP